jgi:Na+/melibiose symporter-like transporter
VVPNIIIGVYLQYVYTDIIGLSASLVGTAWVVSNVLKIIAILGLSKFIDKTPVNHALIMLLALPLTALTFVACWITPPLSQLSALLGLSEDGSLCVYLTTMLTLFGLACSIITLTRGTLLSTRFPADQRSTVAAWEQLFVILGVVASMILPPVLAGDGWKEMNQMVLMITASFCVTAVGGAMSVFAPAAPSASAAPSTPDVGKTDSHSFLYSLSWPFFELAPFRALIFSHFLSQLGLNLIMAAQPLFLKYHMVAMRQPVTLLGISLDSKSQVAAAQSVSQVVTMVAMPLWFAVAARGYRLAWYLGATSYSLVLLFVALFNTGDFFFFLAFQVMGAVTVPGLYAFPNVMLTEIADYDSTRNGGINRMGTLKGLFTNNMILSSIAQGLISSFCLDYGGYVPPENDEASTQSELAMLAISGLMLWIPIGLLLLSMLTISRYPDLKVKKTKEQ